MSFNVDLHIHTEASDSSCTVKEVLQEADKNNIKIISITDHNSLEAYKDPLPYSKTTVISGIELTAIYNDIQIHILGYGFDVTNKNLNKKLEILQFSYLRALQRMMIKIDKDFNIKIYEELKKRSLKVKRKNICSVLLEFVSLTKEEVYKKYLDYEYLGLNVKYLSADEAISIILESGGIPVLAHPNRIAISRGELEKMINSLKQVGLLGIEVYHPSQINLEDRYLDLAQRYSLLISGGSDDHGNYTPKTRIGYINHKKIDSRQITLLERINYQNEKV